MICFPIAIALFIHKYIYIYVFWLFGLIIMKTSVFGITDIPTCHCFDYDSQIAIAVIVISRELQK